MAIKEFVAIDFETATSSRCSACSLGIVKIMDDVIHSEHVWLIQPPENEYNPINSSIHGINSSKTLDSPNITNFHQEIYDLIHDKIVIAHNMSFDLSVLKQSFEYYNLPVPIPSEVFCTMNISKRIFNIGGLKDVCSKFDIELNHHEALSDARACAMVFVKLQEQGIELQPKKEPRIRPSRQGSFSGDVLVAPNLDEVSDKETVFYNKKVVITGVFSRYVVRRDLGELVKTYGGDIQSSISKNTNIVIAGDGFGPSKMQKVQKLQDSGVDIMLMFQDDLYDYLDNL